MNLSTRLVLIAAVLCSSVHAFAPPTTSFLRPPRGGADHLVLAPSPASDTLTSTGARPASSTRLNSVVNSPVTWAIGHMIGGVLATPLVIKATNSWYTKIALPSWTPPNRVFAPVWTCLYSAMGVSAARVYQSRSLAGVSVAPALGLWAAHYALNLVWAPTFFGKKRLRLGMAINCLLVTTLATVIPMFYQINPLSGLLLLPYLAWLTYATVLNNAICKLNPTVKGYNEAMLQSDLFQLQQKAADYANGVISS